MEILSQMGHIKPMRMDRVALFALVILASLSAMSHAEVGDPQLGTDHPWYPGELACSTFEQLAKTQAELYQRVTGQPVETDETRALASWFWRNTHYWHGEDGPRDLWGTGFQGRADFRNREYWSGLFAHGFGLCGTTHSQWVAEMNALLGSGRSRVAGVDGHNSFEVFLKGGPYGAGKWVLLDHDLSTLIFDDQGERLLSIFEIGANLDRLTDRDHRPEKQRGWLVSGLAEGDGQVYRGYHTAEYLAGYAGPPPMVHLRKGETLRRYFQPGLEDGTTFVYWGRNANVQGIPGPERSRTWVNQPEAMHGSRSGSGFRPGQARFANAVFHFEPDFTSPDRDGIIEATDTYTDLAFSSPYVIAASPAADNTKAWGILDPGCRNGLVLSGKATCLVSISIDDGATWRDCGRLVDGLDLTDHAKGRQHYRLRLHARADELAGTGFASTTVCQANSSILPRLKDGETTVTYLASDRAVLSAGPDFNQAKAHIKTGAFGTPRVTLELGTPKDEPVVAVYAGAHIASSNPPSPEVKYQAEYSTDEGKSWKPLIKDWSIVRQGDEPKNFWSQSLCWGSVSLPRASVDQTRVQVRFHNNGGKSYLRAEMHLVYQVPRRDAAEVTYAWSDDRGEHHASHRFEPSRANEPPSTWRLPTGKSVRTKWVEMSPVPANEGG